MNAQNLLRLSPFLRWPRLFTKETLRSDAIAGITGAVVVLPQGVAFASIAGLPPQYGLYAGMVPAIVAALFGSSWHLISGPTTAASIVLFSVLSSRAIPGSEAYVQLAITLAFMVGVIQLALGILRLGALVNFISHSVLVGFTAGAAVLIAASQLKHFLGVTIETEEHAYQTLFEIATHLPESNPFAIAVALVTLLAGVIGQRYMSRIPYILLALAAGTLAAALLDTAFPNGTGLSYVPSVPPTLPPLSLPLFSFEAFKTLAPAAVALTLLTLTEAVSIARSLAIRSGQHLDGNQEFLGQGLSNIAGSFFSSYVATGSFNRSALNYQVGARTPLAALLAGILLIAMVPLVGPFISLMPKAAMAGILLIVAWSLIDIHHISKILRASRPESFVMGLTFFTAVVLDLESAIMFGVLLSLFLYLFDAVRPRIHSRTPDPRLPKRAFATDSSLPECPQLKMVRVDGSMFFGAVHHVQKMIRIFEQRQPQQQHLMLIASGINSIDVSGAEFIANEATRRRARGGGVYLYRPNDQVLGLLRRGDYLDAIGEDHLFRSKQAAIAHITAAVDPEICRSCTQRTFLECRNRPGGEDYRTEDA